MGGRVQSQHFISPLLMLISSSVQDERCEFLHGQIQGGLVNLASVGTAYSKLGKKESWVWGHQPKLTLLSHLGFVLVKIPFKTRLS